MTRPPASTPVGGGWGRALALGAPLVLAVLGAVAGYAWAQDPTSVVPPGGGLPAMTGDLPSWVIAVVSTGGVWQLLKGGGLAMTISLSERDRDLIRDLPRDFSRT